MLAVRDERVHDQCTGWTECPNSEYAALTIFWVGGRAAHWSLYRRGWSPIHPIIPADLIFLLSPSRAAPPMPTDKLASINLPNAALAPLPALTRAPLGDPIVA